MKKCPICETQHDKYDQQCRICNFSELGKIFPTEEDAKYFYDTIIVPYRRKWNEQSIAVKKTQVGDIVTFGNYKWRVLDVQDNKALIITEDIIEIRAFNGRQVDTTWEMCDLRKYLNGEFFRKFDITKIVQTTNINLDNQWFGTRCGNNTNDNIFLLSLEEVVRYFGDSGKLSSRPVMSKEMKEFFDTNIPNNYIERYFRPRGYPSYVFFITDKYNTNRVTSYRNEAWWWWLRSLGGDNLFPSNVGNDGCVHVDGGRANNEIVGGVRPALWLKLTENTITTSGRKQNETQLLEVLNILNEKIFKQPFTEVKFSHYTNISQINSLQRAVINLSAMGDKGALNVLNNFSDEEIEHFLFEAKNLINFPPTIEQTESILNEFYELCITKTIVDYKAVNGEEKLETILEKRYGANEAKKMLDNLYEISLTRTRNEIISFICKADYKTLLYLIQNEQPQTIALILSYSRDDQMRAILSEFNDELIVDITKHIDNFKLLSDDAIFKIENHIKNKISSLS